MKRINGFTLLELILVVLLLSILLSFASVRWGDLLPKNDKETFPEKFSIEIALLRENAISDYQTKVIEFDLTKNIISIGEMDVLRGFVPSREIQIPKEYLLKDVVVNGEKFTLGKALMRLYSTGLVDKAILHLEGEKEGFYSITINPLTARISGENGYIEEISIPKRDNPT